MSTTSEGLAPNKAPVFFISTGVLTGLALILVVYRLSWGWIRRKTLYADDYLIAGAMVNQIVAVAIGDLACYYAFGRHKQDIARTGGNAILGLKFFWLFQVFYKLVLCLNKLSFISFYLRIFPTKKFRIFCYIMAGVVIGGVFSFVLATIFQCVPVQGNWIKTLHPKCIDNSWFRWWWAGYNTATDLIIFLMPMPLLARLKLDKSRKIGVMLMFALGLFVCVTSIIRMTALVSSVATTDPTWGSFDALTWSAIEASCGIICACLPFLKHPLKQLFPRMFTSLGSQKARSRPTYKLSALSTKMSRNRSTGHWESLDNDMYEMGSQDPIAPPNQIVLKTDVSVRTDLIVDPEKNHYMGHAI